MPTRARLPSIATMLLLTSALWFAPPPARAALVALDGRMVGAAKA